MKNPDQVPDGFEEFARPSPFLDLLGQIWVRRDLSNPRFGIRVSERHLNNKGTAHGGVISTLADIACGYTLHWSTDTAPNLITVHLATEFIGAARHSDWLEATGTVIKLGKQTACSQATLRTDRSVVGHATALFHIPDHDPQAQP